MNKRNIILLLTVMSVMIVFALYKRKDIKENSQDAALASTEIEITKENKQEHILTFLKEDRSVDFTLTVKHGEQLLTLPDTTCEEYILNYWYDVETGIILTTDTYILEDATYEGSFWNIEDWINKIGLDVDNIDTDMLRELAEDIRKN